MSIVLTRHEEFAVITIERPEALNALSMSLIRELEQRIDEAAACGARALLFRGAGERAFCAGADIPELMNRTLREQQAGLELGQRVFAKLDTLAVPSVALVHGFAFGGGLELALACTFRLVTDKARMGLPEIKLGLMPGYGGTQRLPRAIGEARAMEMILTGRTVKGDEAVAMGLANRMVGQDGGDAFAAMVAFAREFSGYGLLAQQFARRAVQRALDTPLAEGLRIESDLSTLAFRTSDAEEGMRAFLEKRPAKFTDQ
ncbi:MAG: enoyl-CoA hydratase/isomerase family protein [Burkholderiaceae bacterium]|nr:enoyl-CoA hydratase/isomerase family protein [Burkholderiaceae bacterium]